MIKLKNLDRCLVFLTATVFGAGKIKFAPGTFGSLMAIPTSILLIFLVQFSDSYLLISLNYYENQLVKIVIAHIAAVIFFFIAGIIASNKYMALYKTENDPSEIVIDELVGQLLTITLCSFAVIFINHAKLTLFLPNFVLDLVVIYILPFILFRLFDIAKPWPVNWIDANVKGGFGIMLDDVAAALLASLFHYAIIFAIIDLTK